MKLKLITICIIMVFFCITLTGQNFSKEFGKIGQSEVDLKQYAADKNAEAVVLFDKAKSHFVQNDNFEVVFERTTRIKILSEPGIKWAEVEIPFYQEGEIFEKVYDIEAVTYNFDDGKLDKSQLNLSNTFNEKRTQNWNVKKFALPNVKAGSVIEYRYKIISQYKFNFRDWEFQWKIPVVHSEYEVHMIPFYEYTFILQGANKFDEQESYESKNIPRRIGSPGPYGTNEFKDMVYRFVMKDVPAFNDEEFISSINDYIIKLDFQLSRIHHLDGAKTEVITTWDKLNKELLKDADFGLYIKKAEKLAPSLLDVKSIAKKTEMEKFNEALDFVKGNYNWNNERSKFASKTPKQLSTDKFGNSADLNLMAIGLLNNLGIEAYPVIISTRDYGKVIQDYPFSHLFNYVIIMAVVDGNTILSDATEVLSLNDRIPLRCINGKGLIVNSGEVKWIGMECLFTSVVSTFLQIEISDDEQVTAGLVKQATEYDALYYRNNYTDKTDVIKERLGDHVYLVDEQSISVQNQKERSQPYILKYTLTSKPEIVNEKIYISPFLNETLTDNPLKQNERRYPVDMVYPKKKTYNSSITIPEGYQVDYIPEEIKINNSLFELNYTPQVLGDKIQVLFDYTFKLPVYKSTDYLKIKSYFNEIVKKGTGKIVLTKNLAENN